MWCSKRHLRSLSWHRISVQRMSSWRVRSHPRPYWEFKDNYSWVLWREKGSLLLWKCSKHFLLAWSSCRSLKSWAMRGVMQPQFWIWVFLSETFFLSTGRWSYLVKKIRSIHWIFSGPSGALIVKMVFYISIRSHFFWFSLSPFMQLMLQESR